MFFFPIFFLSIPAFCFLKLQDAKYSFALCVCFFPVQKNNRPERHVIHAL